MLDCDTINYGCNGGSPRNALLNILKNGLTVDDLYRYIGNQSTCKTDFKNTFILEAFEYCPPGSCNRDKLIELLSKGPLISTMDDDNLDFALYDSGFLDYKCHKEIML
jgi:hypothetical protein